MRKSVEIELPSRLVVCKTRFYLFTKKETEKIESVAKPAAVFSGPCLGLGRGFRALLDFYQTAEVSEDLVRFDRGVELLLVRPLKLFELHLALWLFRQNFFDLESQRPHVGPIYQPDPDLGG